MKSFKERPLLVCNMGGFHSTNNENGMVGYDIELFVNLFPRDDLEYPVDHGEHDTPQLRTTDAKNRKHLPSS